LFCCLFSLYFCCMRTYYIKLFDYDRFANELILKAMLDADEPEKPVQLMAHLLAAQQVWLNRCMVLPPAAVQLWSALGEKHDDFAEQITSNNGAWRGYLGGLTEPDFEKIISYKNTKGDSFEDRLSDILAHVINHGTHHRAQIGQLLKFVGFENLPGTDYVLYLRQLKN
jgi:uncharacterized damage-inducible protein DinB